MPLRPLVTRHEQDLALFPGWWHRVGLALGMLAAVAFPVLADARWLTVGNLALVAVVGAVGLMILTGFTGQVSLGHAAFLAVGAYTAAILGERLHLPFWLALPAAGLAAAAVGLAVGPFALRLKGLYLAIVTLGLLALVNHVLLAFPQWTHGVSGIAVPMYVGFGESASGALSGFNRPWTVGPVTVRFEHKLYVLNLLVAAGAALAAKNLARSNTGRAMMAVRDHDLVAAMLGVHPARAKIVSFGLSSFFGGAAGALFAFQQQYITVGSPFDLSMSVQYIAIIVLGGLGTVFGAVAGAVAYVALAPLSEEVGRRVPLLDRLTSAQQATVLLALVVSGFLIFDPMGLHGIWLRVKRYFAAWPFKY